MKYEPDPRCETCQQHGECICAEDNSYEYEESCGHIAIVSISKTEIQCMDCLQKWDKTPGFKSDFPEYDIT